ncbi:MAG: 4-alpha-glucanotransferase [Bacteroidetes bacterium GWA2_30_7]|nr:MAG: 4-alpha-glucanotransferase [Bacteroidetes bacterium GWA2_30_7]
MKVLMFGWEFPPHITGGLGTACFGLTKGLLKQGVEVLFVVPKAFGDESQEAVKLLNASDVVLDFSQESYNEYWKKLSYVEVGSNLIPYFSPDEYYHLINKESLEAIEHSKSIFSKQFKFSGKYGKDLMQEVSRYALVASKIALTNNFDIIHAHDWLTYPAGIAAKEISGKPLVVHVHATEFDRSGDNVNQAVYDIEKRGMEIADKVITVSNLTREIVINKYGISPDKIYTVHNAVEQDGFDDNIDINKGVKEKIVTFLGRITFQKGPDYFVEAAYKVIKKYNNVRFVMAGSGDMMNRMIRRVAELQIADKFHFAGFLKGDDVVRMFGQSDVYVMPSVSEPFGISPLEAMRSSVPVIISKQSGVSEILHYALKVDFWDIDAIADCIFGLLHYDGLSEMFKKYGKTEVDNLKWENAAFLVNEVYKSAII